MKTIALFPLLLVTAPLAAQDLATPPPTTAPVESILAEPEEEEGGLTGSVSFEGNLDDLGIAIPAFAADRDVATPTNASGTAALSIELARVVTANLQNNGLFKPTGPDALSRPRASPARRR